MPGFAAMDRPARLVLVAGRLDSAAMRVAVALDAHREMELLAVLCGARGDWPWHRLADAVLQFGLRRSPLLFLPARASLLGFVIRPKAERAFREGVARLLPRIQVVPDVNAPDAIERLRSQLPDILVLRDVRAPAAELLAIPRMCTLAVHHGRVPEYRGRNPTFWEMYHGEAAAGAVVLRVDGEVDTGPVVHEGVVPIGNRSYATVVAAVEEMGAALCAEAVLALRRGDATFEPQRVAPSTVRGTPTLRERLRLWWRWLTDV